MKAPLENQIEQEMFFTFLSLFSVFCVVQSTNWYQSYWCGGNLQYLDDSKCVKKFPSVYNRDWTCPAAIVKEAPGFQIDGELSEMKVDTSSLAKYVTDSSVNACLVVTKRVANSSAVQGFSLYHRYFCAGEKSASEGYETWSRYEK
jgi:hypothetical protein